MNRSYSKIRHIQEANQKLEKRVMTEQNKFVLDPRDLEIPNEDKLRALFLSNDASPEVQKKSKEFKKAMQACVSEKNLYKVKGLIDNIETKKGNFFNTMMTLLFDNVLGGKSIGQEFNEFSKCVNQKIGDMGKI